MNYIYNLAGTPINSMQNLWAVVMSYLPEVLTAFVVLMVGLLIADWLGGLAKKLVGRFKVDSLLAGGHFTNHLKESGVTFSFAGLVGWAVKWFFIVVFLIAVADILGWQQVNIFLKDIALYMPRVVIAIIILMIGLITGKFLQETVKKSVSASRLPHASAGALAALAKWAVVIFTLLAALVQLGIANSLIEILFTGLVAMLALAGGLAFGLGGKDKAREWLDHISRDMGKQ